MTNKEIYRRTLTFSLRRLLFDTVSLLALAALCTVGFLIADKGNGNGLIGLGIALVIGIIILGIVSHFFSYIFKAGQIAMMTKGVTEGTLPEDVYGEGKAAVKKRFTTIALYYAGTRVIRGIFNQLAKGLSALGNAIGGDTGSSVADAISSVIQVIVGYLCDCCLGWVFFRSEQSAGKATCEGAVLFFKHGKTLMKNLGRVFGLGFVSFLVIGGVFFGIFFGIFSLLPATFERLSNEIVQAAAESGETASFLSDPKMFTIFCAAIAAIILWTLLHNTFVRPFVLVGVLRNYIESGISDIPDEKSFAALDAKSSKFKKLHAEAI